MGLIGPMRLTRLMRPIGPMGPMSLIGLIGPIGLISLMSLIGCSEDQEQEREVVRQTMKVVPCASMFIEEKDETDGSRPWSMMADDATRAWTMPQGNITRAWTPPADYVTYDAIYGTNGMFASQNNLTNNSIVAFFTRDANFTDDGKNYQMGTFTHHVVGESEEWHLNMEIKTGSYYVYGFIPSEAAAEASITGNSIFSEGAELTLTGVKTVTPNDVCVIIGAKEGSAADNDDTGTVESPNRIQPGQFAVNTHAASFGKTGEGNNYIFLLFDHLYSAIRFRFTVAEKYNSLRTIRLRSLEMMPYSADGQTEQKELYDIKIKLKKNTTGTSPIGTITYTKDETSGKAIFEPLFSGEETLTPNEFTPFMGSFVPGSTSRFILRSTYDVYDKNTDGDSKGNLIRKGCTAENHINLPNQFSQTEMARGHIYTVNLTVQPTYLYMLSEPDLDNPTVVMN